MGRDSANRVSAGVVRAAEGARQDTETPPAAAHGAVPLPGCLIHSDISVGVFEWISRTLLCDDSIDLPGREAFQDFHATLRVKTFDDIDICVKIVTAVLALGPIATMGLREIIVNAVEHGNLGISFDEKTELLKSGTWQTEIERRLGAPELRDRAATVEIRLTGDAFRIDVTDQGEGFDWATYTDPEAAPTELLHGRGISLAMGGDFSSVEYRGAGNEVVLRGYCVPAADA